MYNAAHGSTSVRKHVDHAHFEEYEKYKKKVAKEWMVSASTRKKDQKEEIHAICKNHKIFWEQGSLQEV